VCPVVQIFQLIGKEYDMLELKNISKSYKTNQILKGVNLTVNDGEMVALLGPSGSGKSTILRLIAGFLDCNEGEILLDGANINTIPAHQRNIGVVFQDYALFPHMTVEQNVEFGLKMHKVFPEERKTRVHDALASVGMEEYGSRYPKQLSGGQQQRVAIARVVAIRAKVMLLDEPLSNLDAKLRRQVRVELKNLQRKLNITTVIVTHDQEEAMTMGDRIAILGDGLIQQVGNPMDLYMHPANRFVAGFLGTPSINLLDMECSENAVLVQGAPVQNTSVLPKLHTGKYQIGVRPEDLSLLSQPDNEFCLPTEIIMVEHLGAESLVYFNSNGKSFCCRTGLDISIERGQKTWFHLDYSKISIFNEGNGDCIYPVVNN